VKGISSTFQPKNRKIARIML